MRFAEIVEQMQAEKITQRQQEREMLEEITQLSSLEFAEAVQEDLDSKKHCYSFDVYLELVNRVVRALRAGIPTDEALELVRTGYDIDKITR